MGGRQPRDGGDFAGGAKSRNISPSEVRLFPYIWQELQTPEVLPKIKTTVGFLFKSLIRIRILDK
jgi:hypothetical protein